MDKVQRRIGPPVLTALHVEPSGLKLDAASLVPARLPDLFPGSPLTVLGRYRGAGGSVVLQGRDEAGRAWSQTVSGRISDSPAVAPVWARGHLRVLEDRYVVGVPEPEKLAKQIVEVSLRFGVLCRFTAYVAVDKAEVVNAGGKQHQIVQPVEAPAGWDMLARGAVTLAACAPMAAPEVRKMRRPKAPTAALRRAIELPRMMGAAPGCAGEEAELQELAPPAAAPGGATSGLGTFFSSIFGRGEAKKEDVLSELTDITDLAAYRRTAREMLEELRAHPADDRLHALGILSVKLTALIEDLKSVGAPDAELGPLVKLQAELRQVLAAAGAAEAEVSRVWKAAEAVLQAFAGRQSQGLHLARRQDSFWK